jgi:hypothetical protein
MSSGNDKMPLALFFPLLISSSAVCLRLVFCTSDISQTAQTSKTQQQKQESIRLSEQGDSRAGKA